MNMFTPVVVISLALIQLLGIIIVAKKPFAVREQASAQCAR